MSRIIFFILFGLIMSHCQQLHAQARKCDLTAEFVYPDPGHLFESPGNDSVVVNIINLGPDSIYPSDQYSFQLRFGGDIMFPNYATFNQYVAPNGKFSHIKRFKLNHGGNVDSFRLCVEIYAVSPPGYESLQSEKNSTYDNNRVCTYAEHRDSTYVGVHDLQEDYWSIYPNPSNGVVFVRLDTKFDFIKIYSMQGQEIDLPRSSVTKKGDIHKISGLKPGTYLVVVQTGEGILTKRLIVM